MVNLPSISIDHAYDSLSLRVGHARVEKLKRSVQEAILTELFEGGGISIGSKDAKGRFIRENGTYVLDWQQPLDIE